MGIEQIKKFLTNHGIKLISIIYNKEFVDKEPFKSKIKNHGDKLIVIKNEKADIVEFVVNSKNEVKSLKNGDKPEENINNYVSKIIEIYRLNIVDNTKTPDDKEFPKLNLEFMFFCHIITTKMSIF